jgi:predicted transcriptional regulator
MSEILEAPHCGALKSMFWRSEILQVMFWLWGEGLGEEVDVTVIERFLGVDSATGIQYLDELVSEGLIDRIGDRYRLSELGRQEGGIEFAESFEELTHGTHGECGPDCPHCFPPDPVDTDCTEGCPAFMATQERAR